MRYAYFLAVVLVAAFPASVASGDPNCGAPCITILPKDGAHDCSSFVHMELLNHAAQAATVKVLVAVDDNGKTWSRTDTYTMQPKSSQFLGCTGSVGPTHTTHSTYSIQSVAWH